ncbi:transposase [Escherichia coli]|nr:transposase [Escherichia coli]
MGVGAFWLSEAQFKRLRPLFPDKVRGVARVDDRRVASGITHVVKSRGRWVDAPACYISQSCIELEGARVTESRSRTHKRAEMPLGTRRPPTRSTPLG